MDLPYWVYILRCNNGNYYTGSTTDLQRRYQEHRNGSAKCKYTRSFRPLAIAQCWKVAAGKNQALKIENFIKKLPKREKEELIRNPEILARQFACEAGKL